ncbi:MAG: hypothetical protein COU82_00545 [Candidatus Portnoybacteria bacterium CG10_big_fil_rev_8_21_14_0_10_38_18]|uniref:DOD-type homing endonuclease domain-containing protein n=1 Tax=Candidatus Portnoybacteria bacterium CG10_big_fil_rev_8_21_14_0_10_38_18 TaxID=1974813 RepID=A0A2M8KCR8_9BACT|nr:MAG: hypothetical protein COU82_00545 [Candidatus Portnoybacteria bacterium CG10_big_fil_rev_8_21_14_0_10_38_18]
MKKCNLVQIWDLTNYPSDLNIIISKNGRDWIRKKLLEKYGLLKIAVKKLNMGYWGLIDNLRGRRAMNFSNLIKLIQKLNLNRETIQKEIQGLVIRSIKIKNVHFPIRCDPIFVSLFTNLLGDGGARGGNGSGYFHYGESEAHQLIQEKISHILGETPYQNGESVPRVLVFLLMKYFNIKSVATKKSVFPPKIVKADKLTRLASLTAFINDEGTPTTSFIQIYSSNSKLLRGIQTLSQSLGYKVSQISRKKDDNTYLFRINSVRKFYDDYKELIKKYPEARLISRKERTLRILDLILTRPKRSRKDTFDLIIKNLKNSEKNIYDLCEIAQMTQSGVRKYLKELITFKVVKRQPSNSKTRYIYSLA